MRIVLLPAGNSGVGGAAERPTQPISSRRPGPGGEIALLRDLFVWAYGRSCSQYRVVREALGEPDSVRFRYRDQLADLVRETVRSCVQIERRRLGLWGQDHGIRKEDQEAFVERAMDILLNLTEGAISRYGLSNKEVDAWRGSMAARETQFNQE